ncbi:hypothetical protein [Halostella salina]|uniref:hypothetical protein n=1 Tax=Halostella salina TaxID=1547897 RepID=UPI000EF79899|nr:hypothetical protein [Halostella salina]
MPPTDTDTDAIDDDEFDQLFETEEQARTRLDVAADIVDASMVAIEDAIDRGEITRSYVTENPGKTAWTSFRHGVEAATVPEDTDIRVPLIVTTVETAIRREYGDEPRVRDA